MPVEYERDDRRRLITVRLTEPFSLEDLLGQIDRQWTEHVWEYAVLYEGRPMMRVTSPAEIQEVVEHTRIVGGGQRRGPLGLAIPKRAERLRRGLQVSQIAAPLRDIEILLNDAQIEAWITRHAPQRGSMG